MAEGKNYEHEIKELKDAVNALTAIIKSDHSGGVAIQIAEINTKVGRIFDHQKESQKHIGDLFNLYHEEKTERLKGDQQVKDSISEKFDKVDTQLKNVYLSIIAGGFMMLTGLLGRVILPMIGPDK